MITNKSEKDYHGKRLRTLQEDAAAPVSGLRADNTITEHLPEVPGIGEKSQDAVEPSLEKILPRRQKNGGSARSAQGTMKTLVVIMAHREAYTTVNWHFPLWERHAREGADLLFVFPEGQIMPGLEYPAIDVGVSEHHGPDSVLRFFTMLKRVMVMNYDRYVFMEYDSFILGPLPDLHVDLAGNFFQDFSPTFTAWMYIHQPWMCHKEALRKIVAEMEKMAMFAEHGHADRVLGLAVERAKFMMANWITNGYGYSQNTIYPEHYRELEIAIRRGARAIHGVKTKECLKVILDEYALLT